MNEPRKMHLNDIPAAAKIVSDWIAMTPWTKSDKTITEIEDIMRQRLKDREIYVVGNPVAGYITLNPKEHQITGLYCSIRGAGYGKSLMDCVKKGRDYLQLWTDVPNVNAQCFYQREGFCRCETAPSEAPGAAAELRMEWHR